MDKAYALKFLKSILIGRDFPAMLPFYGVAAMNG